MGPRPLHGCHVCPRPQWTLEPHMVASFPHLPIPPPNSSLSPWCPLTYSTGPLKILHIHPCPLGPDCIPLLRKQSGIKVVAPSLHAGCLPHPSTCRKPRLTTGLSHFYNLWVLHPPPPHPHLSRAPHMHTLSLNSSKHPVLPAHPLAFPLSPSARGHVCRVDLQRSAAL